MFLTREAGDSIKPAASAPGTHQKNKPSPRSGRQIWSAATSRRFRRPRLVVLQDLKRRQVSALQNCACRPLRALIRHLVTCHFLPASVSSDRDGVGSVQGEAESRCIGIGLRIAGLAKRELLVGYNARSTSAFARPNDHPNRPNTSLGDPFRGSPALIL